MADHRAAMKAQLLAEIDKAWVALNSRLARLSEVQMTTLRDHHGWTVKDHLTHLTAWEDSVVFFLHGRPRHEALQVEASLLANGSFDEINDAIQEHRKDLSLAQAIAQLRSTHDKLMRVLQPLTDADLNRHLPPDPSGSPEAASRLAIDLVRDNTADHFSEHLAWIDILVSAKE